MIEVDGKKYITINESCIVMGISVQTFHRWKREDGDAFPASKEYGSRQKVYLEDDILRYQKSKLN